MALYTRTGDKGFTLLPGPEGNGPLRVRKDDARMIAMGDLDELNAAVGVAAAEAVREGNDRIGKHLTTMQEDLLRVGAVLAGVFGGRKVSVGLGPAAVKRIEKHIDAITAELPKLTNFILPGGGELAARLHLARAISRRTERDVVSALNLSNHSGQANSPQAVIYATSTGSVTSSSPSPASPTTRPTSKTIPGKGRSSRPWSRQRHRPLSPHECSADTSEFVRLTNVADGRPERTVRWQYGRPPNVFRKHRQAPVEPKGA